MASSNSQVPFSFVARWIRWLSHQAGYTTKRHEIDFSEGLLETLYYETDIGSIPRGADTDVIPPKYKNNPNWNKRISGCYWCMRDRTHVQGICCSKECIYYLHEWCVERMQLFQKKRFCKRPGCEKSPVQDHICCSRTHHSQYTELYKWVGKEQLNMLVSKGPEWYNNELSFNSDTQIVQSNPFISSSTTSVSATMDLATELKAALIFYTDVGPVPRAYKKTEHSVSQHSDCINWRSDVTGCYQCGGPVTERCEYLCSEKCYLVFNEWCRLKVVDANNTEFCEYPGCGKKPQKGYSTCNKEHFEKRNSYLSSNECYRLLKQDPHWYKSTQSSSIGAVSTTTHLNQTKSYHENPVNPSDPFNVSYLFSRTLTEWMYKESDIGPIPRSLLQISYIGDKNKPQNSNWNTMLPACYWCCGSSTLPVHSIACCEQCFFLFNEWCHKQYNIATFKQICKFLHCEIQLSSKRDCCYEHTSKYSSYTQKFGHLLKSSDFALGPKWYSNKSVKHIDFYNREDPFYEFTNFFFCTKLAIDGKVWKTAEHYFQAQKFLGTPHMECVRILGTPRDTFQYTRRPDVQRWIRPDWTAVKESVMLKALEAKFSQNECLAQLLVRTGDMRLFEHTRNDAFWGDGGDRKGQNKLGQLLMQVRFDLQRKCPFLPSKLEHIQLSTYQSVSPVPHVSNSAGSNLSSCTPGGGTVVCAIGGGTSSLGERPPVDVPHGASPRATNVGTISLIPRGQEQSSEESMSSSDTGNTLSCNGTSQIPGSPEVMYSNYGTHNISTSTNNTSSQTRDNSYYYNTPYGNSHSYNTNTSQYQHYQSQHSQSQYQHSQSQYQHCQRKIREQPLHLNTASLGGDVQNKISEIENKRQHQQNNDDRNTNPFKKNYPAREWGPLSTNNACTSSASVPSLYDKPHMNSYEL